MSSLSIVIPVYNSEATIGGLVQALLDRLAADYDLQIVLVDDASRDGSAGVCRRLAEARPREVTFARLSRNFGEHNAVMAGLNLTRGAQVVVMDDDFQNPPDEVPRLLETLRKGYDVVYCSYPGKEDAPLRNLASFLNGTMARVVLDKPANLYLSSFKAMTRFLVREVVSSTTPHPYVDALILRVTRNIGVVEARHDPRRSGRSGYTLRKLAGLWGNMVVSYSLVPLRAMSLLGLVLSAIGVFSVVSVVVQDLAPALLDPSDLDQLTAVSTFFRGIQLLATGTVGEYIGRIYLKLDQEPQFIIRELRDGRADPDRAEERG
jgi:glycosyltransferase involved in cell wall biosynthesis